MLIYQKFLGVSITYAFLAHSSVYFPHFLFRLSFITSILVLWLHIWRKVYNFMAYLFIPLLCLVLCLLLTSFRLPSTPLLCSFFMCPSLTAPLPFPHFSSYPIGAASEALKEFTARDTMAVDFIGRRSWGQRWDRLSQSANESTGQSVS